MYYSSFIFSTQITCMHSSYTPPLCHALPYVSQLTATELIYCKLRVQKLNIL